MNEEQLRDEWARTAHGRSGIPFDEARRRPHLMHALEAIARGRAKRDAMAVEVERKRAA